jgi:magnesium-transporting ATPase (P-type)
MNYHEHHYPGKDQDKAYFDSYAHAGYGAQKPVSIATILIWLVVIALITWFLLWAFKPDFVQENNSAGDPTGQIDYSQLFLWTAVITLIITFLIWIFLKASGSGSGYGSWC